MNMIIEDGILKKCQGDEETVIVPDGVKEIGEFAFAGLKNTKNIIVPEGVTKIGDYAFNCSRVESVVLLDSLTELGSEAFYDCSSLGSLVLGNGIKEIKGRTFFRCRLLDHLELPEGLEKVAYLAFDECYSLSRAWVYGKEYRLRDREAPQPVKLVKEAIMDSKQKVKDYYDSGAMDYFEYIDYQIAGDGYSI